MSKLTTEEQNLTTEESLELEEWEGVVYELWVYDKYDSTRFNVDGRGFRDYDEAVKEYEHIVLADCKTNYSSVMVKKLVKYVDGAEDETLLYDEEAPEP